MLGRFVLVLPVVFLAAVSPTLRGQPVHPNSPRLEKVVQVRLEDVIDGIQVHQKLMEDLKKRFEPTKTDLAKRTAEIDSLRNQLDQGKNLSDKEQENLATTIAMKTNALLRDEKQALDEFEKVYRPARRKILSKLTDVMRNYAKKNGYAVILETGIPPTTRVAWASQAEQIKYGLEDKPWPEIEKKLLTIFSVKEAQSITQELIVACNAEIHSID